MYYKKYALTWSDVHVRQCGVSADSQTHLRLMSAHVNSTAGVAVPCQRCGLKDSCSSKAHCEYRYRRQAVTDIDTCSPTDATNRSLVIGCANHV